MWSDGMITLEARFARIYFVGDTFAHKEKLRSAGCHWDGERKAWWIGKAKAEKARKLIESLNSPTMEATPESRKYTAELELRDDTPAGIVADKLLDLGRQKESEVVSRSQPLANPNSVEVVGKATYKGRSYYIGGQSRDGEFVKLFTLPNEQGYYLAFWAKSDLVTVTKTYNRCQNQTLGSIARFIEQQKKNRGTGSERVQCPECDAWHIASEPCRECGGC
jgi:hypothetical protein